MSDYDKPGQLDPILKKRNELNDLLDIRFKRPVTILITDIVGSKFFSTHDDIQGRLMIQRCKDVLASLVAQHKGNLIEIVGDTILAFFEQPAHAVTCAVIIQETLVQGDQDRPEQDRIRICIGIHQVSEFVQADHVYGVAINIAERVKSLADDGDILISESVYRVLEPERIPLCIFMDKIQVEGREEEIKVYRLIGERENGAKHRGLSEARIDSDLVLEVSHRDRSIELSVYERNETDKRTLLPYEELEVEWERIEASCREVIALLNRANRRVGPTAEILSGLKKSGRVLFELLIAPRAREKLNSALTRNLILYVDEKLVQIPWELLFDGQEFLCRRFAMGRIVSTRQTPPSLSTRTLRTPFQVLVLADPRGDLGGAYREGIEIRNFLDVSREIFHVDFKSHPVGISFVKKNLRDYDIVHYAGHADYLAESPSESGWLLNDGRLKASEVSAMGGRQPMPSLVFCNACQTAQTGEWTIQEGYEQRIFGLANAYLLAGVRHYIGTFWEVLDEPSSYFAKGFYDALASGESIGEALRKTRQDLIQTYGEEVLIWTSYVLYGDPTFRLPPVQRAITASLSGHETAAPKPTGVKREEVEDVPSQGKVPSSHYPYAVSSGLLLASIVAAYFLFYPEAVPEQEITPVAVTQLPSLPSPTPEKEAEKTSKIEKTAKTEKVTGVKVRKDAEEFKALEQPAVTPATAVTPEVITPPSLPQPPAIVPKIAEAPKYKVGDSWTLRLSDGQKVTRKIRAIESGLYVLECDSNRWQYLDRDLVLRKEVTFGGRGLHPPLVNQRLLYFPLSLDKSWEFKIPTAKTETRGVLILYWRVFRHKVIGNERIETPAGTFGALKIEQTSYEIVCDSGCDDVPDTSAVRQLWYAPEARLIVKVAHVSGKLWQGEEPDYELISLDLK